MAQGWVSVHRQLQNHWLWEDKPFSKGQAWIDILMLANHEETKFLLGNQLIEAKRGEVITSEIKLMERWGWSKTKVRSFLEVLQNDSMLLKKSDTKKTVLNIVKYDFWQDYQTTKELQKDYKKTAKRPQKDTINNDNNDNNDNKDIYISVFDFWNSKNIIKHHKLTEKLKRKISSTSVTFSLEDIKKSITNYEKVLHDDKYYWSYVWTLEDFLQRGIDKFLTDICFKNYIKKGDLITDGSRTTTKETEEFKLDTSKFLARSEDYL